MDIAITPAGETWCDPALYWKPTCPVVVGSALLEIESEAHQVCFPPDQGDQFEVITLLS